jgi:hypothetical protein
MHSSTKYLGGHSDVLGGLESLIEHRASMEGPESTTPANLIRLSVGLEHIDDLTADLDQALRRCVAIPESGVHQESDFEPHPVLGDLASLVDVDLLVGNPCALQTAKRPGGALDSRFDRIVEALR